SRRLRRRSRRSSRCTVASMRHMSRRRDSRTPRERKRPRRLPCSRQEGPCWAARNGTARREVGAAARAATYNPRRPRAAALPEAPEQRQATRTEDEVKRYMQAQQMMSDAINQHLGFRGYGLMMRLQKTGNVRDLHDLLPDFAKALVKRIGMAPATPIVGAIERL